MGMGMLWALRPFHPRLGDAFLGPVPFVWLAIWTLSNQIIAVLAMYCRTAGTEPFVLLSIASAWATLLGTLVVGSLAGMSGVALWLAMHNVLVFVPWAWFIFRRARATIADEQP
jgi:hypothetical protein